VSTETIYLDAKHSDCRGRVVFLKHDMIYLFNCSWVVTRWQYTFTHKQYREKHNIRTTQITNNVEECGPCPVFASFTLAFALQLRKKHGKTSVRVRKTSVSIAGFAESKNINHLKTKRRPLYLKTQSVPRSKHFSSRL